MEKTGYRLVFLIIASVFLISQASGSTFGSFPYQLEKKSGDLSVEYQIGLVNIGDSPLKIRLDAEESREYNVSFQRNRFELEPSEVTRDPKGNGWYHLGDGRYVKVDKVTVQVEISRYREDNSLVFPVTVTADPANEGSDGVASRLLRVREHGFRAEIDPELRPRQRPEKKEEDEEQEWKHKYWEEESNTGKEDFNLEQEESNNGGEETKNRSTNKMNRSSSENPEKGSVNSLTYLLVAGIAVSVLYVFRSV